MIFYVGLLLSALIGLSLGLLGSGGSILTVPILVYLLGVEVGEAVVMSLAIVGFTSSLGAFLHYLKGNVEFSKALSFGISGMLGTLAGTPLTSLLSSNTILLIFALLTMIVATSMFWRKRNVADKTVYKGNIIKAILSGFGVGVLTGFLGVGGGFLIVPALVWFGGLTINKAIGTSLVIITMNSFAGFIGHIGFGVVDLDLTLLVTLLAICGAVVGTILSSKFSPQNLQKSFACMIFVVGLFLVCKNV